MPVFNIFRASFDGSLRPRERRRARIAATALTAFAAVAGSIGLLAMLHLNSDSLTEMASAGPARDVKVLGATIPDEKPCEEQTWPFIAGRCLAKVDPAKTAERSTTKHGLASGKVPLPSENKTTTAPLEAKTGTAKPAVAVAQSASPIVTETTGAAPRPDEAAAENIPLPSPRPHQLAALNQPAASQTDSSRERARDVSYPTRNADLPLPRAESRSAVSDRESRRERKENRRELRREREARQFRSEARRSRAQARDDERIVRRWTEYTYVSPNGGSRRVIVIRRGSRDDDFFTTMR